MKKTLSLLLSLSLALTLCACGGSRTPASSSDLPASQTQETEQPAPAEEAAPEIDTELPISVMVLNGTTGFGMAKLIRDAETGEAALNYRFSVESDASSITAALINGSADIAALPTNAAAALYNKSGGAVQCLALNTLGVLYLVADSEQESVSALADLEGKTVYAPAQNPSFIFAALCEKAGVNVTVDNTYAQPADLRTAVAADEVRLAVLPEPLVSIALDASDALTAALDLTEEWDRVFPAGSLVQGCAVVRTEFAAAHPAETAKFLEEYGASVAFPASDPAAAADMIVSAGIFTSAPVAQKAIPNCNLCFLTGEEMKTAMSDFLSVMLSAAPASIGGALPADDFYCILK